MSVLERSRPTQRRSQLKVVQSQAPSQQQVLCAFCLLHCLLTFWAHHLGDVLVRCACELIVCGPAEALAPCCVFS